MGSFGRCNNTRIWSPFKRSEREFSRFGLQADMKTFFFSQFLPRYVLFYIIFHNFSYFIHHCAQGGKKYLAQTK